MTVLGLDSFVKANQSGWNGATVGGSWSLVRSNQALSIASNEGVFAYNGSTTTGIAVLSTPLVTDVEILVRASQSTLATDAFGICCKFINTSNFYEIGISLSTSGHFQFRKNVASTFSTVTGGDVTFTTTPGTFYWLRVRVLGTNFFARIWQDGTAEPNTWNFSVSDSSLTAAGQIGVVGAPQSGDNIKFDSFYAVDYLNSEALILSDSPSSLLSSAPVEALTLADSAQYSQAGQPVEALALVDAPSAAQTSAPVEALALVDAAQADQESGASDTLPLSSLTASEQAAAPVDSLALTDAFTQNGYFLPVENMSISIVIVNLPFTVDVIWLTRDNNAIWLTRDNTVTWLSRDENTTWTTRG